MALKWSPLALSFEPTALDKRTVTAVPGGKVTWLLPNMCDVAEASAFSPLGLVAQATDAQISRSKKLWRVTRRFKETSQCRILIVA